VNALAVSCIIFACIAGAGLLAMLVGRALPAHHLSKESQDTVKQGLALIATLAGFSLALLVATAKGAYDSGTSAVRQLASEVRLLDRLLAHYGPETKEARALLRHAVAATLNHIWPSDKGQHSDPTISAEERADLETLYDKVAGLVPQNEAQRGIRTRSLDMTTSLAQTRLRLADQKESSIPLPFLVVLVFWLMILLAGCGLMAPRNATVLTVLLICSLSVAGALFLILDMASPFDGVVRVSSAPLREALARLGN
jgi:hypothetical protein